MLYTNCHTFHKVGYWRAFFFLYISSPEMGLYKRLFKKMVCVQNQFVKLLCRRLRQSRLISYTHNIMEYLHSNVLCCSTSSPIGLVSMSQWFFVALMRLSQSCLSQRRGWFRWPTPLPWRWGPLGWPLLLVREHTRTVIMQNTTHRARFLNPD